MISAEIRSRLQRELEAQGREMKELSIAAGLGETYVRDVLKRGRGKIENLVLVASELGKSAEWLFGSDAISGRPRAAAQSREAPNAVGREPIPNYGAPLAVLGVSRGGEDGRLLFNGEVIEYIPRPAALEDVAEAYASYVVGDSMYPRFKEGDRVWVHPRRPPRSGNDVIVQLEAEVDGEPPEGYIKEFVKYTAAKLVLKQHNPSIEIEFDANRVRSVHVIVGTLFP